MLGNVAKPVLDLLFPPLCIGCRAPVGEAGFCAACWSGITFLDGPGCACCGLPFPVALEGENLCAACLAKPPAFDSARAILAYDDKSRGAILALKHADRLDLVPGFARWLGRAGRSRCWRTATWSCRCRCIRLRLWRAATTSRPNWRGALARDWNLRLSTRRAGPQPRHPQPGRHGQRQGAAPQCASAPSRFPIPAGWRESACCCWMM